MGQKQKKEKTGATGQGRITREQIEKWNPMTDPPFETGGGGDIRSTRLPLGPCLERFWRK